MITIISTYIIPVFLLAIVAAALLERLDIFALFVDGVNEGLRTVVKIFPSILAITIAINLLTETGSLQILLKPLSYVIALFKVPQAVILLIILRPISGSASTAMVLDIFAKFGPDSLEGVISSIVMASSETTFYILAVLFGSIGIKNHTKVTIAAVVADITAVILTVIWAVKVLG